MKERELNIGDFYSSESDYQLSLIYWKEESYLRQLRIKFIAENNGIDLTDVEFLLAVNNYYIKLNNERNIN